MSIWASIPGDDPKFYLDGYIYDREIEGFMDVAVSVVTERVRIIADSNNEGIIILDADGLKELHRRIVQARSNLERRQAWLEQRARSASSSDSSSDGTSEVGAEDGIAKLDG